MKRLLTLCVLLHCHAAYSQHVIGSVDDVWQLALDHNTDCMVYELKTKQAQQEVKQVQSHLYPAISVIISGQANIDLPETPVPGELFGRPTETIPLTFGQKFQYSGGISVSMKLLDWQSHYKTRIARLNKELSVSTQTYFIQTLKEQLAVSYYLTLTSKLCNQILETDFRLTDTIVQITNQRHQQGLTDALVLNQAKIIRNQILQQQHLMNRQLVENTMQLKELTGLAMTDSIVLVEAIAIEKKEVPTPVSPNTNYLNLKELQCRIAGLEVKKNYGNFLPKIELYSFWGYRQYQEKLSIAFRSNEMIPENYIGIRLSVPVFTGFATSAGYQHALIAREVSSLYLLDAERITCLHDFSFSHELSTTGALVELVNESLQLSFNNLHLAKNKYVTGLTDLETYLKVLDSHLAVENQYFEALSNHFILKAKALARSIQ